VSKKLTKRTSQDHYLGLLSWGCYPKPIW